MVNQKLGNPFVDLGTHVYGDRFVGRKNELKNLQGNCASRNISIQGLPKIGKTSLAYQGIIHKRGGVSCKRTLCPVFFNVGTSTSADDVFKRLVKSVRTSLIACLPLNKHQVVTNLFDIVKEDDYDRGSIQAFFESGVNTLPVDIVIVFDEFDKVKTLQFAGHDFALLRAILSVSNVHGTITSKQSIYSLENWNSDPTSGPSNFYQLFQGNTIHLKQYNDADLVEYWARLEPYFEAIGLTLDDAYKDSARYYAGRHPHLLDVYNAHIYDYFSVHGQMPDIVSIRTTMKDAFDAMISILKKEDLLKPAIQVLLGPVYDLDVYELDKLLEYDFIQEIEVARKLSLLGSNYGYFFNSVKDPSVELAYLAPSEYFSLLFRRQFTNKVDFWDEWTSTIHSMHILAQRFFLDNWGDDWENMENPISVVASMKQYLNKDKATGVSCSPLLEYLTEKLLRDLFDAYWDTFSHVFFKFRSKEFFDKFDFLLRIRHHHAHVNSRFLSDQERETANNYLKAFKASIDEWFASKPGPLAITSAPRSVSQRSAAPAPKRKFLKPGDVETGTLVKSSLGYSGTLRVDCGLLFDLPIENVDLLEFCEGDKVRFLVKAYEDQPKILYATDLERIED